MSTEQIFEEVLIQLECDHDWMRCDDSYSHDWQGGGVHKDIYWECQHCGLTTRTNPIEIE